MSDVSAALAWIAVLGLLEVVRGYLVSLHAVRQRFNRDCNDRAQRPQDNLPNVTVIRPIKGLDTELEANLAAALDDSYPGEVQTLFVLDEATDPAYPTVLEHVEAARGRGLDVHLRLAGEPTNTTGKLHAMLVGYAEAEHDLIAFADSDTRAPPTMLVDLVRPLLADHRVGATFAPVVVANRPETPWDVGYALLLNGMYGANACLSARRRSTLPFIMGQFMAFRRDVLEAIGGLEGTAGELVDDMSIGQRVHAAGFENHMIHTPLPIIEAGLSWGGFLKVYERWIMFSRRGIPARFKLPQILRVFLFFALLITGLGGVLTGAWGLTVVGLGGAAASGVALNRLHAAFGGAPTGLRHGWVAFVVLLLGPYVLVRVLLSRQVDWRGRVYHLDASARLAARSDLDPNARDRRRQGNLHPPVHHH